MAKHWYKILCVLLLAYVLTAGFLFRFPALPVLNETIRNVFFHVPMWYTMIICFTVSGVYAIKYLMTPTFKNDLYSVQFAKVGLFFGLLGLITGMEWAGVTWGEIWSSDPKQIGAAACLSTYLAYIVLRNSIQDDDKIARISAVYNIFAFALLFPLVYIIPAHSTSLHPGGNGKGAEIMGTLMTQSAHLRKVTLPALFAWVTLGIWITTLTIRYRLIEHKLSNQPIKTTTIHD
jgi:heme exporter protein C